MELEAESYRKIKLLGEGAFGKAFLVEYYKDQTKWVMKQMDISAMTAKERDETIKEAKILEYLQHPNIVKFKEVYGTKAGKLCIVMEYADGGDLSKKVKDQKGQPFTENQILDWFTQICLAMKHVHDRKILHRDLKGQNIFLTRDNRVKLGDFGIARVLGNTMDKAKTQIGTPYYLSPEIIESKPYSYASDIWSLGAVLYEMCTLKPPFLAESLHNLALKIVKGQYTPISQNYSKDLKNLVAQLLQTQPSRRPTIHQILKSPVIVKRIKEFLTESVKQVEFAHTILHNKKLQINVNMNQIKMVSEDMITRPPLLKQSYSEPNKAEIPVVQEQQQQIQQPPAKVPSNQILKQPAPQPQVQQNKNIGQQFRQPQSQQKPQVQQQQQKRIEKPVNPSAPQNKISQPQQQPQPPQRVVLQKPASANKRSTSKNKVVDQQKQEAERAKFMKIKEEADKKRQLEEEKLARQKQAEQEQKNKQKEEYRKKRELEQKLMQEDLQRRRNQKNQQSQEQFDIRPQITDPPPMDFKIKSPQYILQQQPPQQSTTDEQDLEEYFSKESSKNEIQHVDDDEEADDPQNYGVQYEEHVDNEQIEDAHYILDLEEILADVQDMNEKVKELDQFEMKKKDILESQIPENIRDDDEDIDFDLTLTTKMEAPMTFFGKPDSLKSLRISLTQVLGQENFERAVSIISLEIDKSKTIGDINTKTLLGFIPDDDRIKYVPLLFEYTLSIKMQDQS